MGNALPEYSRSGSGNSGICIPWNHSESLRRSQSAGQEPPASHASHPAPDTVFSTPQPVGLVLPHDGSVEGEVQLLVSSRAVEERHHDHNGEEATPNASERKAAIDDTGPLTSDSPSQSVSALPQNGSVEGEVQLLVSSRAGAGNPS